MAHFGSSTDGGGATTAALVSVTPTGGIGSTNAQAALAELDTEKATVAALSAEITARGDADTTLTAAAAAAQTTANNALPKAGGTMTGPIVLAADPAAALQPVTRQYLDAAITALINGAPAALDTLKEISDQLATDESAVSALTTTVAGKLAKASNLSDLTNAATARTNLGLGNVDNTSDANKPVSTAQATADAASVTAAKGLPLGSTGATAATRYAGATASGAPSSGTFAVGDFVIAQTGTIYICTAAGSPGTWTQAGGGISATTVDAKGDLLVGTADNTVARKAVGADGLLLSADASQADGLAWTKPIIGARIKTGLGLYHAMGQNLNTARSIANFGNGRLRSHPAVIDTPCTISGLWFRLTTAVAASTVRLGIYADDGGRPGALVYDAGTVATTATGIIELTVSVAMMPGLYHLATAQQSGATGVQIQGWADGGAGGAFNFKSTIPGNLSANGYCGYEHSATNILGALPDPFTHGADNITNNVGHVGLRIA